MKHVLLSNLYIMKSTHWNNLCVYNLMDLKFWGLQHVLFIYVCIDQESQEFNTLSKNQKFTIYANIKCDTQILKQILEACGICEASWQIWYL